MKVALKRMWTAKCEEDCSWLEGDPGTVHDVNPLAKAHYKETGHTVLVRRIDAWVYRKPNKKESSQ